MGTLVSIMTIIFMFKNSKARDEEERRENEVAVGKKTKYVFVKLDAWVYNGSDKLWKSILIAIWEAVGEAYGYDKIGKYRFSVELERNKRGRNNNAIDAKSTHQAREEALASFQMSTILSTLFAITTGAMSLFVKFRGGDFNLNERDSMILTVVFVVIGLVPLTRQLSIFFKYILISPFTTRVQDKTMDRRQKYLNDSGFREFVFVSPRQLLGPGLRG